MPKRGQSRFARYDAAIRKLAGEGATAGEIASELQTPGDPRSLRKYMEREGIPRANQGGQPGEKHHSWNGGVMHSHGYRYVMRPEHPRASPAGYVREHLLVMEQKLGRPLEPGEVVHHEDGDRQNNDPANLRLFESNGAHLAETRKGKAPNWTAQGRARLEELWASRRGVPRAQWKENANPPESGSSEDP